MRIVHVIPSVASRLGGPSNAVLEMSRALAVLGHTVDIVTTALAHRGSWAIRQSADDFLPVVLDQPVQLDGYSVTYCTPVWPTFWALSFRMIEVLKDLIPRADVVHIHDLYLFPTLLASRLSRGWGVPYVIRPHGALDPYILRRHRLRKLVYTALFERSTLRHAAAIHFMTEEELDLATSVIPDRVKKWVIPHGVDLETFAALPDRDASRRALRLPDQATFVWLFLGRLSYVKGLDLLAPAFVRFCRHVPNAMLLVAGPDDEGLGKRFLSECTRAGVRNQVKLTGLLNREQMRVAFAAADSWVLPSYSENFGLAVVEAMAGGLPVLISDRVKIWRSVAAAAAGIVVRPEVDALFDAMLGMSHMTQSERTAMGLRGRELCRTSYSWKTGAARLSESYAEVAQMRRR